MGVLFVVRRLYPEGTTSKRSTVKADLHALQRNDLTFRAFLTKHAGYFERMVDYFYRRNAWVRLPVDRDDLLQIAKLTAWQEVKRYRFRCPVCPREMMTAKDFMRHAKKAHKAVLHPKPSLEVYIHGRVGSAIDHELTRHRRRHKFTAEMPENPERFLRYDPRQEAQVELRELTESVRPRLQPVERVVFDAMLDDESPVPALRFLGITADEARGVVLSTMRQVVNA